jgi:hypothetical protein
MRRVILESPYADDVDANVEYARRCVRDALSKGEAPLASHLLYTQPGILRDEVPTERQWGIDAGLAWLAVAEATVVYTDRGISKGMKLGIAAARARNLRVEERSIGSEAAVSQRATDGAQLMTHKESAVLIIISLMLAIIVEAALATLFKPVFDLNGNLADISLLSWSQAIVFFIVMLRFYLGATMRTPSRPSSPSSSRRSTLYSPLSFSAFSI